MGKVLFNHELIEETEAKVSIDDRGYQFGDGVYEVIRFYDGNVFELNAHVERFVRSAREIGIQFDVDSEKLKEELRCLVKDSGYLSGYVYAQITRGVSERSHIFDESLEPQYIAYVKELKERPYELMKEGGKVLITEDIRWLRCDIKSLNLLGSVMLKNRAADIGAKEAVLHRGGVITEGSSTNVFAVKNGALYTPPADNYILNGITRRVVIDVAKSLGLGVVEIPFSIEFLASSDEAFTTSSIVEIMPITNYEVESTKDIKVGAIGSGSRGPLTKLIQERFTRYIQEKDSL